MKSLRRGLERTFLEDVLKTLLFIVSKVESLSSLNSRQDILTRQVLQLAPMKTDLFFGSIHNKKRRLSSESFQSRGLKQERPLDFVVVA